MVTLLPASTIVPNAVIFFLPTLVMLERSLFAALSILSFVSFVKVTSIVWLFALVVTYAPSPFTVNVWLSNNTSFLPLLSFVLPAILRFTLRN